MRIPPFYSDAAMNQSVQCQIPCSALPHHMTFCAVEMHRSVRYRWFNVWKPRDVTVCTVFAAQMPL
jgi:hypothetical protein